MINKKILKTTLAICIMSAVCSTSAFASEVKTTSTKNVASIASQDNVIGYHDVSFTKTYKWGTLIIPARINVQIQDGRYYMSDEDYRTPIISLISSSDSASVTEIQDSKLDKLTYKVQVTFSHNGMTNILARAYFKVDPNTGAISATPTTRTY